MEATQNVWHGSVHTSTDTLVPIESSVSSHPVDITLARGTRIRYDSESLNHVSVAFNLFQIVHLFHSRPTEFLQSLDDSLFVTCANRAVYDSYWQR